MKYLMLIKHAETTTPQAVPQALMGAMGEFVQKGFSSGILKDTAGLKPTSAGYRIRSSGGKLQTFDGPLTETKEVIGGFAMIETASAAEAREMPDSSWSFTACTGRRSSVSARSGRSRTISHPAGWPARPSPANNRVEARGT